MAEFCAHSFLFGWCFEKRMRKINFSEKRCAQIFGRKRIGELPNLEAEPRQRVSARDLRERWPDEVWRRSFHRRFRGDFSRRLSNVDENAAFQRIDEKSDFELLFSLQEQLFWKMFFPGRMRASF